MSRRTFRNPQGDGGFPVHIIGVDDTLTVIQPGESAEVEWPEGQPTPDALEEASAPKSKSTPPVEPAAPEGVSDATA